MVAAKKIYILNIIIVAVLSILPVKDLSVDNYKLKKLSIIEKVRVFMSEDQKQKVNKFLKTIQMIESSGGKNLNHPEIESGIHEGHRAIGGYGLMPNTVQEIATRMKRKGISDDQMRKITSLPPDQMKTTVEQNPDYEQAMAEFLANHVLNKQQGDEEKAAYSWFQGHNLSPERIQEQNYQDHDYVKKYNRYRKLFDSLKNEE